MFPRMRSVLPPKIRNWSSVATDTAKVQGTRCQDDRTDDAVVPPVVGGDLRELPVADGLGKLDTVAAAVEGADVPCQRVVEDEGSGGLRIVDPGKIIRRQERIRGELPGEGHVGFVDTEQRVIHVGKAGARLDALETTDRVVGLGEHRSHHEAPDVGDECVEARLRIVDLHFARLEEVVRVLRNSRRPVDALTQIHIRREHLRLGQPAVHVSREHELVVPRMSLSDMAEPPKKPRPKLSLAYPMEGRAM